MNGNRPLRTLVLTLAATVAAGAAPAAVARPRARSEHDILLVAVASGRTVAPDGGLAAWARSGVVRTDGSGVAIGPSAGRPIEPRGRTGAATAHTGLRAVVGSGT
jgi:hypothetical protein